MPLCFFAVCPVEPCRPSLLLLLLHKVDQDLVSKGGAVEQVLSGFDVFLESLDRCVRACRPSSSSHWGVRTLSDAWKQNRPLGQDMLLENVKAVGGEQELQ